MDKTKNTLTRVKNHVARNKIAYVMTGVAIGAIALQQRNRIAFYQFLTEKGVDPLEYYCPEAFAEMQK